MGLSNIPLDEVHIDELLACVINDGHHKLYISVGEPPTYQIHGIAGRLNDYEAVKSHHAWRLLSDIMSTEQIANLRNTGILRFNYDVDLLGHFDVTVSIREGEISALIQEVRNDGANNDGQ